MDCTPSLQSTLHNWTRAVNSTTPNIICIVLHKRYFAFTFPIDFAVVMSPQAASGMGSVSASRHKNEAQTLHHPCLLGSPWWGEINIATLPLLSWGAHGGEKST